MLPTEMKCIQESLIRKALIKAGIILIVEGIENNYAI